MSKNRIYAYSIPGETGIVRTWDKCRDKVLQVRGASYRKFKTEAEARRWLSTATQVEPSYSEESLTREAIYFDSGTGGGEGVRVKISDSEEIPIQPILIPTGSSIAEDGTIHLGREVTNNFGELVAFVLAVQVALARGQKKVSGDSRLVIDHWSNGNPPEKVPAKTLEMCLLARALRVQFEEAGGKVSWIPGSLNPADLGYHK